MEKQKLARIKDMSVLDRSRDLEQVITRAIYYHRGSKFCRLRKRWFYARKMAGSVARYLILNEVDEKVKTELNDLLKNGTCEYFGNL